MEPSDTFTLKLKVTGHFTDLLDTGEKDKYAAVSMMTTDTDNDQINFEKNFSSSSGIETHDL